MADNPYSHRRLRVVRGPETTIAEQAPVLEPIDVGSIGHQSRDGLDRQPAVLVASLDLDSIPRLRDALTENHAGRSIDVISQWRASIADEVEESPSAYLYVEFPAFDVRFQIRFHVDEYKRSLAVVARTGEVMLCAPDLLQALRTQAPDEAFRSHISVWFTVEHVEPLRLALRQRFDLPFEIKREERRVIERGAGQDEYERFTAGGRIPADIAVVTAPGTWSVICVVDPEASEILAGAAKVDVADRWGHWASLQAGPHVFVRLDVLVYQTRLQSWLLVNPSLELIRATSAGPHRVVVLTKPLTKEPGQATEQILAGLDFPVREPPDSMRALLGWEPPKPPQ